MSRAILRWMAARGEFLPTIFLLTGGGPVDATNSLVVLAYRTVFQDQQVGPGVSIAFIMTLVLVVISTILYRQILGAYAAGAIFLAFVLMIWKP